jgi:hypothetical protein
VRYKLPEDGADPRHGRHPDIQVLVLQQLQHLHTVNGTGEKSNPEASPLLLPYYHCLLYSCSGSKVVPDPKLIHTLGSISKNIFSRKVVIIFKVEANGLNRQ